MDSIQICEGLCNDHVHLCNHVAHQFFRKRIGELRDYKDDHGHCKVPQRFEPNGKR